jgi:D-glycero-alpha-D-manno-heptose-7-phosphate kinase
VNLSQNKNIRTEVPCRVDLSGGTLDLWPLYLYFGGLELVNMAIPVMARCELSYTPSSGKDLDIHIESADLSASKTFKSLKEIADSLSETTQSNPLRWVCRLTHYWLSKNHMTGVIRLKTSSDAPPGSGLGGSSTLGVAIQLAFHELFFNETLEKMSDETKWKIQQLTRDLEAIEIEHPAGDQDYVPALFGGLLSFHLNANERFVERLPKKSEEWLLSHGALLYTGKPHHSGLNNWSIFKALHEGDGDVRKALKNISVVSKQMSVALKNSDFQNIPDLINNEWSERQRLSSAVSAPVLDQAWDFCKNQGAIARKACGSGGGGCLLLYFASASQKTAATQTTLPDKTWKWLL